MNNVKKNKFYLQFIVPKWEDRDYNANGIYYPLVEKCKRKDKYMRFRNMISGEVIKI